MTARVSAVADLRPILLAAALIGGALMLASGAARAQAPVPPEVIKPPMSTEPPSAATPQASSGVITPPANVDPGINRPTPPAADFPTLPVRPPASGPGGTTVVPK